MTSEVRVNSSRAPAPISTITSPSAMMTIWPWRSTKWVGATRQPRIRVSRGPVKSTAAPASQSWPRADEGASEAARIRVVPRSGVGVSRRTAPRSSSSPREASTNGKDVQDPHEGIGHAERHRGRAATSIEAIARMMTSRPVGRPSGAASVSHV